MISFIIPACQEEFQIVKTIKSIQNNSWKNAPEIIVVENGSTDKTATVAKIQGATVYSLPEKGRSLARNFGASKAKGEWLVFLDADVLLDKNWSEGFYRAIEFAWYEVIQGPVIPSGHTDSILNNFRHEYGRAKSNGSYCSFLTNGLIPILNSACFAIKSKKFKAIGGFDQSLFRNEDVDFGFKLFFDGAIFAVSPEMKSYVYWTQGSLAYLKRFYDQGRSTRMLENKWQVNLTRNGRGLLEIKVLNQKFGFLKVFISVLRWLGWKKESLGQTEISNQISPMPYKLRSRNSELPLYWGLSGKWCPKPDTRFLFGIDSLKIFYFDKNVLYSWTTDLDLRQLESDLDSHHAGKGFVKMK